MKSVSKMLTALSVLLTCCGAPGLAADVAGSNEADSGAKGLFYKQLESPSTALNTGVQYWIELRRDGETISANNKTQFHSKDEIRFHVKPNIDGYAYILLTDSSQGEQATLFPDPSNHEDKNQIVHGKEIVLPTKGALVFDEIPGKEKLTLVISRKPINVKDYLSNAAKEKHDSQPEAPQRIAMACSGSKDLVPNQVLVSYVAPGGAFGSQLKEMPAAQHQLNMHAEKKTAVSTNSFLKPTSMQPTIETETKKTVPESASKQKVVATKTTTENISSHPPSTVKKAAIGSKGSDKKSASKSTPIAHNGKKKNTMTAGIVTVVYKDPGGVLAADISLEHL